MLCGQDEAVAFVIVLLVFRCYRCSSTYGDSPARYRETFVQPSYVVTFVVGSYEHLYC